MPPRTEISPQQQKFDVATAAHRAYLMGKPVGKRMDARNEEFGAVMARGRNIATSVLTGANFAGAQMQDCDLSMADLFGAVFSLADLSGCKLRRALRRRDTARGRSARG